MKKLLILSASVLFLFSAVITFSYEIEKIEEEDFLYLKLYDFNANDMNSVLFGIDYFDRNRAEIDYKESLTNRTSENYTSELYLNLEYKGIMRGLKFASLNFDILRTDPLTNRSYKLDTLTIKYKFKNSVELSSNVKSDFFYPIENKRQITDLINKNRSNSQKTNSTQNVNKWFNSELKYYKFYTNKDGIAELGHSEIIELQPDLESKQVKYLNIFNRGNEVKWYSDENNIVNGGKIYFLGSRTKGDSTHFSNYVDKEPFFVTYDVSNEGSQYNLKNAADKGKEYTNVEIQKHFEEEYYYGFGEDLTLTETSVGEGWYWAGLHPSNEFNNKKTFDTFFEIYPISNIELTYKYNTDIFSNGDFSHNKTLTYINDYGEDTITTKDGSIIIKDLNIPENSLLQGSNQLSFNIYKAIENDGKNNNGVVGFDYFRIKTSAYPIAIDDAINFGINTQERGYIDVYNFSNNSVIAIDTLNNEIQFPNSTGSTFLSMDAIENVVSFRLNNNNYNSGEYGYHLLSNIKGSSLQFDYFIDEESFLQKLNSFNGTENTAVIINLESNISANVKNQLGSKFSSGAISSATNKYMGAKTGGNLYESTNSPVFEILNSSGAYKASLLLNSNTEHSFIINSKNSIENVKLENAKINEVEEAEYDMVMLYHSSTKEGALHYKNFREGTHNINILELDVERVYDTYGYGLNRPHSIRNLLTSIYNNWEYIPEHLLLIGDATWDPRKISPGAFTDQLIPAYGKPYSDHWYTLLDGDDLYPEMMVARIPISNPEELDNYLDKVKTFEEAPLRPWMKKFLAISGGNNPNEISNFNSIMKGVNSSLHSSNICADTITIGKSDSQIVSVSDASRIKNELNSGKIWTNFLGHGSPNELDMKGWEAHNLSNKGRYGVLNTLACNTSAFAEPTRNNSIGEEFLLEKDKGFISVLGGTATNNVTTDLNILFSMLKKLTDKNSPLRNLGSIFHSYKINMHWSEHAALHQFVMLGDPLIDLKFSKSPNHLILEEDVDITNKGNSDVVTQDDSIAVVKAKYYNLGTRVNMNYSIRLIHTFNNKIDTHYTTRSGICIEDYFEYELDVFDQVGNHTLEIFIDPADETNDADQSNNFVLINFNVFSKGLLTLDPRDNWNISAENSRFRFVDPTGSDKDFEFKLLKGGNEIFKKTDPAIKENYIEFTGPALENLEDYVLEYRIYDKESENFSDLKSLNLHTTEQIDSIAHLKYNYDDTNFEIENLISSPDGLKFNDKEFEADLIAVRGGYIIDEETGDTIKKPGRMIYMAVKEKDSGLENVIIPANEDRRGFSLIIISDELEDTTIIDREFDTWDSRHDAFPDRHYRQEAIDLVKFLRDSLTHGDYLLLGTRDESLRTPGHLEDISPDSTGSLTTLRNALKDLGAKHTDSIKYENTYALFTRIGYPETTIDGFAYRDTVRIQSDFKRFTTKPGRISLNNIGPAKRFIDLNLTTSTLDNITHDISVIKSSKSTGLIDTLNFSENGLNLEKINAKDSPFINLDINIKRDSLEAEYLFNQLDLKFVPTPELAIINSTTKLDNSVIERGNPVNLNYGYENISLRSKADSFYVDFKTINNFSNITDSIKVENFNFNSEDQGNKEIVTNDLATENTIQTSLDSKKELNELYYFNNSIKNTLNINEDEEKPWFKVYADGVEIKSGDYVTKNPTFKIELYDNSPLDVTQDDLIFPRINRRPQLEDRNEVYEYQLVNDGNLKAVLVFKPDTTLDYDENSLNIAGRDGTGNYADTLDLRLFVSRNYILQSTQNSPNPFANSTEINYEYIGRENGESVKVSIYDAVGAIVRTIENESTLGENSIHWDARDNKGNKVSSGVYLYRVDLLDNYADPIYGKMVRVK